MEEIWGLLSSLRGDKLGGDIYGEIRSLQIGWKLS